MITVKRIKREKSEGQVTNVVMRKNDSLKIYSMQVISTKDILYISVVVEN